uniref:ATP-binding protein n=1 Tax=Conchiformibius kuhniae TaxID=211502 RepID=A0A8T9MWA0_9NEIS|nr:ATP-binding protein [Conchiformibius kuhniae]
MSKNQLLVLMLGDGFSTVEEAGEDAGKGVGMGIIKETVHQMGGKMNIATAKHQYTRFSIKFPKAKP